MSARAAGSGDVGPGGAGEAGVAGDDGANPFRLGFLSHVDGNGDARQVYRDAIERFVLADQLGFEIGWVAQHHFFSGGGRMPSPLTFLAAVAERTERIRLSTAVIILPLEDPLRLAEDLAVLNAISGGRVEVGVSTGYGENIYEAFGKDMERRRETNTESVIRLREALEGKVVNSQGDTLEPPEPELADRIWQGVFSEDGSRFAARSGSHLLLNRAAYGYDEPTDVVQRPWADAFLDEWTGSHPPRIGLSRLIFPAKDRAAALDQIAEGSVAMAQGMVAQGRFPAGLDAEGYLRKLHAFYGHPEQVTEELSREQVLPVATDLLAQFNPGLPTQAAALRALELIATEVAPALGWRPAADRAPLNV